MLKQVTGFYGKIPKNFSINNISSGLKVIYYITGTLVIRQMAP